MVNLLDLKAWDWESGWGEGWGVELEGYNIILYIVASVKISL